MKKIIFKTISLILMQFFLLNNIVLGQTIGTALTKNQECLAPIVQLQNQNLINVFQSFLQVDSLALDNKILPEAQRIIKFLAVQDALPANTDALVVFGNEDLQTPLQAVNIFLEKNPKFVVFAGGVGHSTTNLIEEASSYLGLEKKEIENLSEAEIFKIIFVNQLKEKDFNDEQIGQINFLIDDQSRNSQENARNALQKLFEAKTLNQGFKIILMQKPLLQRRAAANFKKEIITFENKNKIKLQIKVSSFAPYVPELSKMDAKMQEEMFYAALDEIEKLKMYATPRFGFIDPIIIPAVVEQAFYALDRYLNPIKYIESDGKLVAGLFRKGQLGRTSIDNPLQIEANVYRKGSSYAGFSTKKYQGVLYLAEGKGRIDFKDAGFSQDLSAGDIVCAFGNSDVVFTEDVKVYAVRQTDALNVRVDFKEKIAGEEETQKGNLIKKNKKVVGEVFRDKNKELLATIYRNNMYAPDKTMLITPVSAAIQIGVKTAQGKEQAHRHAINKGSKMEVLLTLDGSFRAFLANKKGTDIQKKQLEDNDLLVLYPDSVHGYEFNQTKLAVIMQNTGEEDDKIKVALENNDLLAPVILDKTKCFAIIKPDKYAEETAVIKKFNQAKFRVIRKKEVWLTKEEAEHFYAVHKGKPFYDGLVDYMSSGPIIQLILQYEGGEKGDAWSIFRNKVGKDDGTTPGSWRNELGVEEVPLANGAKIRKNGIHCSDSFNNVVNEAAQIKGLEIIVDPLLVKNLPEKRNNILQFYLNQIMINAAYEELNLVISLFNLETKETVIEMGLFDRLRKINDLIFHFSSRHSLLIPIINPPYMNKELSDFQKIAGLTKVDQGLVFPAYGIVKDYSDLRVAMYVTELNLDIKNNWFDRQFADFVKDKHNNKGQYVWSQKKLINDILKPNLQSSLSDTRYRARDLLYRCFLAGIVSPEEMISEYVGIVNGKPGQMIYRDLACRIEAALELKKYIDLNNAKQYKGLEIILDKIVEAMENVLRGMKIRNIGDFELSVDWPNNANKKYNDGKKKILEGRKQMMEISYLSQIIKKTNGINKIEKNGLAKSLSEKTANGFLPLWTTFFNNKQNCLFLENFIEQAI